jgi:VanZ family protein
MPGDHSSPFTSRVPLMKRGPRWLTLLWLRTWGPVVLWVAFILTMSSEPFAARHTGSLVAAALRLVFPDIRVETLQTIHAILRKVAHVVEYAMLGALSCNALRRQGAGWFRVRRVLVILALALACALVDEGHQALIPARTGSPRDVLLDTMAALLGAWGAGRFGTPVALSRNARTTRSARSSLDRSAS